MVIIQSLWKPIWFGEFNKKIDTDTATPLEKKDLGNKSFSQKINEIIINNKEKVAELTH
jgi:hypothetical protein